MCFRFYCSPGAHSDGMRDAECVQVRDGDTRGYLILINALLVIGSVSIDRLYVTLNKGGIFRLESICRIAHVIDSLIHWSLVKSPSFYCLKHREMF